MGDPLASVIVGATLTVGVGGTLTYLFQNRAWQNQRMVAVSDQRRERRLEIFDELSVLFDRRLYAMRRLYWSLTRADDPRTLDVDSIDSTRRDYRDIRNEWNANQNRILAAVEVHFSRELRVKMERLQRRFAEMHRAIDAVLQVHDEDGLPKVRLDHRLSDLAKLVTEFDVILLNIIQSNELPNEEKSRQVLPDRLLQVGMVNDRVRRLQEALGLIPDGEFGPSTLRAVFERQQELGIKVDGVVGPATLDALGLDGKLD